MFELWTDAFKYTDDPPQVHYNTFVDILELKEYVMELLTNISVEAMSFDIRINFSLTANFLDILCRSVVYVILNFNMKKYNPYEGLV